MDTCQCRCRSVCPLRMSGRFPGRVFSFGIEDTPFCCQVTVSPRSKRARERERERESWKEEHDPKALSLTIQRGVIRRL